MTPARHLRERLRICSDLDEMPTAPEVPASDYYVVMIDHGRRGREATVDPEITRREVVERIARKDYGQIAFIHHVTDAGREDVTNELLREAGFYDEPIEHLCPSERLAALHDHDRKLRVEA